MDDDTVALHHLVALVVDVVRADTLLSIEEKLDTLIGLLDQDQAADPSTA